MLLFPHIISPIICYFAVHNSNPVTRSTKQYDSPYDGKLKPVQKIEPSDLILKKLQVIKDKLELQEKFNKVLVVVPHAHQANINECKE